MLRVLHCCFVCMWNGSIIVFILNLINIHCEFNAKRNDLKWISDICFELTEMYYFQRLPMYFSCSSISSTLPHNVEMQSKFCHESNLQRHHAVWVSNEDNNLILHPWTLCVPKKKKEKLNETSRLIVYSMQHQQKWMEHSTALVTRSFFMRPILKTHQRLYAVDVCSSLQASQNCLRSGAFVPCINNLV